MTKISLSDLNLYEIGNTIQLAGAVYSGNGQVYFLPLPDEDPEDWSNANLLLMSQDEWAKFLMQTDVLEVKYGTGAAKAIVRKSQRQIDNMISWAVYRRDGYRCRYCGCDFMPLTVDHLILWEENGPSTMENMVASCRKCNKKRGNLPYADWLNDPYYVRVSARLSPAVSQANWDLLGTLASIPRVNHIRSR